MLFRFTCPNSNPQQPSMHGPAECAERLNPPPPAGDGVLNMLLKCLIKHNYASRAGPRIQPDRFALMQKKVPKITSVFCCLSGPIFTAFSLKIADQISPKWLQNLFLSIGYSLMPNFDFCNTSQSKTQLSRLLSLPKITNFGPINLFHTFKNVITKLSSSRV